MAGTSIEARNLCKWFGEGAARKLAVNDVSFEARFGEMLYLVGPSGSGKTTLLSIISGILRPSSGQVLVEGRDLWELSDDELAAFRLHTVGFVFQDYHLFPRLSTVENVAVPLILRKRPWNASLEDARKYLEIVGLADRAPISPSKLSGGEQQRVAIARAIVGRPEILVFDEPTASLDGETGRRIIEFVKHEILTEKTTVLVVTHDDRIFSYADRVMRLEDGKLMGIEPGKGDA